MSKKISELPSAESIGNTDLTVLSQVSGQDYASAKTTIADLGAKLNNNIQYSSDLQTTSKTIIGAINELNAGGGGSSTLAGLTDVNLSSPADGQALVYDNASQKWVNSDVEGGSLISEVSGSVANFNTALSLPLVSLKANITATQSGTGTPSPSNPRPISGFSSVTAYQIGKNLLKNTLESQTYNGVIYTVNSDGSITLGGQATSDTIRTFHFYLPAGSYIYTSGITEDYTTYDTYITSGGSTIARGREGANVFTLTQYSDLVYGLRVRNGVSPNITIKPMIRISTDADNTFEPYNANTITISLGDTYYGGVLDVKNGTATITRVGYDLKNYTGSVVKVGTGSSTYFRFDDLTPYPNTRVGYFMISDKYEKTSITTSTTTVGVSAGKPSTVDHTTIFFRPDNPDTYTTTTIMDYIINTLGGVQVVYDLYTPITLTGLTPDNFTTLAGQNNIFADSGDVELSYYNSSAEDTDALINFEIANTNIETLNNVDTSSPTNGQALVYDGSHQKWVNQDIDTTDLVLTATGALATFTTNQALPLVSLTADITAVQDGSGTPSPSNVRNITGFTGVTVNHLKKNLIPNMSSETTTNNGVTYTPNADGTISVSGAVTAGKTNSIRNYGYCVLPAGTYTLSGIPSTSSTSQRDTALALAKNAYSGSVDIIVSVYSSSSKQYATFTLTETTACYLRLYCYSAAGTYPANTTFKPMIEVGDTKPDYETYSNTVYPISWQASAGTVYGGSIDVTTGKLTVTHIKETLKWSEGGAVTDLGTYTRKMFISAYAADGSGYQLCTVAPYLYNYSSDSLHFYCRAYTNDTRIYLFLDDDNLPSDFDTFEVVYALATPVEYTLTPTEISAFTDTTNNIMCDCNGDTTVEYYSSSSSDTVNLIKLISGSRTDLISTLTAGQTSITISDSSITTNSTIDIYTTDGTEWTDVTVTTGSVTITFDAQASDLGVKVRVS